MKEQFWNFIKELTSALGSPRFYIGLPVAMGAIVVARWNRTSSVVILLWETLAFLGYFAAVYDARLKLVPGKLIRGMFLAWLLVLTPQIFFRTEEALYLSISGILGAALCGGVLTAIYMLSRGQLGGGDVKFMAISALYLGLDRVLTSMLYGSIISALVGGILMLLRKMKPKDLMPMVPFLYLGMLLSMLTQ